MHIALWAMTALLSFAFLAAGMMKIVQPKPVLAENGMGFVETVDGTTVKAIGVVEVLGALGLVLPAALDIAPVLVPLAAVGVAIVMVGAIVVHARRGERQPIVANVVLLALALVVAWGRFGAWSFTA